MKNKLLFSISFILILTSFSLIFYSHNEHNKEMETFLYAEKNIHRLIRLSESIDSDLLLLLNFRLNNFDSLAEKVKQLIQEQKILAENNLFSAKNLPISGINKRIDQYITSNQIKLQLLEHIKSNFASYRITLHYIPTISRELNQSVVNDVREHINALYALLFNYNLFPEKQYQQQLQQKINYLQSLMLEHKSALLMENLLFHVNANLAFQEIIQAMFDAYKKQDDISHLRWMQEQIENFLIAKTVDTYKVNNIFLVCIAILLSGLLFAIYYFRLEKSKASDSRDMFHDAIESIDEAFSIYDKNDQLILWNRKFEQLYPKLNDFLKPGISYLQLIEEGIKREQFDYRDFSENEVRQLMLVSHKESLKNIIECMTGGRCYLTNSNRTRSGGRTSVHIDITERQKMEAHLLELSRAVEQNPASVVITNTEGKITYVNPKFEQITGYSAAEVLGENPRILKSGHTSKEEYEDMWKTIHAGKEWTGIFHNKRKNGELFWEQALMSAIRDNQNKIIAYLAIKEDITRRRFNEEQLRMASMVFETSSEAIIVTDSKNRIKLVNPSFEKITGYKADEVMGKSPDILSSDEHDKSFYISMWNTLHRQGRWQGEIWNKRKNG
ncbi:MAG: PAS domain S-box protein, partial [Pseudomonadota bacterium]